MLIECLTITNNKPHEILSCINSITNQTYKNFKYCLYIVTNLDSENILYEDILKSFINDDRVNIYFISNVIPAHHISNQYKNIYMYIDTKNIYKHTFFQSVVDDLQNTKNNIIHYIPKFYALEDRVLTHNKFSNACVAINKNNTDLLDTSPNIRHTDLIIGSADTESQKLCYIDNKYCGIYWFNHSKWQSYIYLNKRNNRIYHINHDEHGQYEHINDNKIKIFWDNYDAEIFQKINNQTSITYNA